MISSNDQSEDAGRLLAAALGRHRALDQVVRELLRRYRSDGSFRGAVDAFARGLGLRVLEALDTGLVLAADADSPFAFRLHDYRAGLSVEDRLCHGMIHLVIAAWCFPDAATLEDEDRGLIPITVQEVVDHLKSACTELKRRATVDPEAARPELQEAWRTVLSRADTRDTGDGRIAVKTLAGMAAFALDRLEKEGLFRKDSSAQAERWLARPAFRVQVRELAAYEAFRLVRSIPRENG